MFSELNLISFNNILPNIEKLRSTAAILVAGEFFKQLII